MAIRIQRRSDRPGLIADISVRFPDGYTYRERRRVPADTDAAATRWARKREAHLLAHGPNSDPLPRRRTPGLGGEVRDGWIYFIRGAGNRIKIGWSQRVDGRLLDLQTGAAEQLVILGVRSGTIADERALHRLFADLHERGEWFRPGAALIEYIRFGTQVPPGATRCPRLPKPE